MQPDESPVTELHRLPGLIQIGSSQGKITVKGKIPFGDRCFSGQLHRQNKNQYYYFFHLFIRSIAPCPLVLIRRFPCIWCEELEIAVGHLDYIGAVFRVDCRCGIDT